VTLHFITFPFRFLWKVIDSIINETKFVETSHGDDRLFVEYSKAVQMPLLDEMQRGRRKYVLWLRWALSALIESSQAASICVDGL